MSDLVRNPEDWFSHVAAHIEGPSGVMVDGFDLLSYTKVLSPYDLIC